MGQIWALESMNKNKKIAKIYEIRKENEKCRDKARTGILTRKSTETQQTQLKA